MSCLSFSVPVLGNSYTMDIDFIRFYYHRSYLMFYSHSRHEPFITNLYTTRKDHKQMIEFFQDPMKPVYIEQVTPYKYYLSIEKKSETLDFLVSMLKELFTCSVVRIEVYFYHDHYSFGKCNHHLLDLYEMGYMTLTDVVFDRPLSFFQTSQMFTGILLTARRPFQRYNYDFLEVELSNHFRVSLSLDMLLQDRPSMLFRVDSLVKRLMETLPLKSDRMLAKALHDWDHYHDFEIRLFDVENPLKQWKPSLFLNALMPLLDFFPSYYMEPRFSLHLSY